MPHLNQKRKPSPFLACIIISNNPFYTKLVLCKINFEMMGYTPGILAYFQSSHQWKDLQNNSKRKTTKTQLTSS